MTRKPYQDTDAWREERRSGYGASDAPILIDGDEAAWQQLHGEKLGIVPAREASETMQLGKVLEDIILREGAAREGWKVQRVNRLVRHPDLPYVFASLDGRIRGGRPVEVKKWGWKSDAWGPPGSDIVPTSILWQLQQQAAVTGADAVEVLTLFGGAKLERFTVGRDDTIISEILGLETAAWAYVKRGEMPPWPGQAPKRVVIAENEVEVVGPLAELVDRYNDANYNAKAAKDTEDLFKEAIREYLADAGGAKGVLPDGRRVTIAHRPNADSQVVAWELVAKAYRKALDEAHVSEIENNPEWDADDKMYRLDPAPLDLDAIESMFTTTKPGARPLRITIGKGS